MSVSPAKLYYQVAARETWGSPAAAPVGLVEILSAKDLTIPGTRAEADTTDRGTGDVETADTGKLSAKLSFQCSNRATCPGRAALKAAFKADTVIALALLDGADDVVGTQGLWADFKVTKFEEVHPTKEPVHYEVEVVPYASAVPFEWVVVSA